MMDVIHIPRNFYNITERHDNEQFFWNRETIDKLMNACKFQYEEQVCCLTTPSLADAFHEDGRDEVLLDIDNRFSYLPKFKYYDVRQPYEMDNDFRLIILDPPFFIVPIVKFREAVDILTGNNYNTKILIGFIKRYERELLAAFSDYNLSITSCELQYASIKPNKWRNFALYSNVDLPGIKRISK